MPRKLEVVSNDRQPEPHRKNITPEEKLRMFRSVASGLLTEAQGTWAEIWDELMGTVTNGAMVLPDAAQGPKCGWGEFLEKLWLLKHYLDYTKKFVEGKA